VYPAAFVLYLFAISGSLLPLAPGIMQRNIQQTFSLHFAGASLAAATPPAVRPPPIVLQLILITFNARHFFLVLLLLLFFFQANRPPADYKFLLMLNASYAAATPPSAITRPPDGRECPCISVVFLLFFFAYSWQLGGWTSCSMFVCSSGEDNCQWEMKAEGRKRQQSRGGKRGGNKCCLAKWWGNC